MPSRLKAGNGLIAKNIFAHARDERDVAARASRADGLIRAFATGGARKFAAENRFRPASECARAG